MPFQIDTLLLKTFIAIAESGSFTSAANMVGRTQSALSLQIKKLESDLNCKLFERNTRKIALTKEGEVFLNYAKQITKLQWEVYSRLTEPDITGEIKFGVPEDFATHYLPDILSKFKKYHPHVQLNVECNLTLYLQEGFEKNYYDIILVKRDPQYKKEGVKVWKEPLVWVASEGYQAEEPLSLVVAPSPCIYRKRIISALDATNKSWKITYTRPSLAGTIAAVKAGLGLTALPINMLPVGLKVIENEYNLPDLENTEIALLKKDDSSKTIEEFAKYIIQSLENKKY
jgi:DNA-binding transcriptional LysR family regulator